MENLYANWFVNPPYTNFSSEERLGGLFTSMIKEMTIEACGSCKPYGKSKLHFYISKTGENPQKESQYLLKKSITEDIDLHFPIYGQAAREIITPGSLFIQLVPSPGCSVIVRDESKIGSGKIPQMISGMLAVWPLLLVSYSMATLFGQSIWFFVSILIFLDATNCKKDGSYTIYCVMLINSFLIPENIYSCKMMRAHSWELLICSWDLLVCS